MARRWGGIGAPQHPEANIWNMDIQRPVYGYTSSQRPRGIPCDARKEISKNSDASSMFLAKIEVSAPPRPGQREPARARYLGTTQTPSTSSHWPDRGGDETSILGQKHRRSIGIHSDFFSWPRMVSLSDAVSSYTHIPAAGCPYSKC